MEFNSLQFLIFFPIVVALYFSIPHRFRWTLLLAASYYFYMCWKAEYLILIIISTMIDYYAGIQMGKTDEKSKRKKYLVLSIVTNLGLLFSFKYFNFFNDAVRELLTSVNIMYDIPYFDLLLPVGISFYTFQTLSYTIDVYRGKKEPERHLGIFALYVSFFPQLVAGPIERSTRLLPQFYKVQQFDYQRVKDGLLLMLWGLFKKIVIADRLAVYVNEVYSNPTDISGLTLLTATYLFAFQIYCDFSGYSDIAIGGAKVLGFDLMKNFNRPYFSKSISEFWKRWHISLSSWFKDYLYIPLGGNKAVKWKWYYNLLITFVVSGLWHGANWTFIVWGTLHGSYLIISLVTKNIRMKFIDSLNLNNRPKILKIIRVMFTFHLVLFAWIFFRANTISDAFIIINKISSLSFTNILPKLAHGFNKDNLFLGLFELSLALILIVLMESIHILQRKNSIRELLSLRPQWQRWILYYGLILCIIILGAYEHVQFIYFQF